MARVCSIDRLSGSEQIEYTQEVKRLAAVKVDGSRRGVGLARVMAVEAMLTEAETDHADILRLVEEEYPGLIDANGNLPGESEQEFIDQLPLFTDKDLKQKGKRDGKKKGTDGGPKRGSKGSSGTGGTGGTKAAGSGSAAGDGAGPSSNATKSTSDTTTGDGASPTVVAKPPAETPTVEDKKSSEPTGQKLAKQTEREKQQPLNLNKTTPANAPRVAELVVKLRTETNEDALIDVMTEIMWIATVGPKDTNNKAYTDAVTLAYGEDVHNLVWGEEGYGSSYSNGEQALFDHANMELNARVWALANKLNLVPQVFENMNTSPALSSLPVDVREILAANQKSADPEVTVTAKKSVIAKTLDTIDQQSIHLGGIEETLKGSYNKTISDLALNDDDKAMAYKGSTIGEWLDDAGLPVWVETKSPGGKVLFALRGSSNPGSTTAEEVMTAAGNPETGKSPAVVDKDAMADAGLTDYGIRNPKNLDPQKIREAPLGYAYVSGTWRLVTQQDVDDHNTGGDNQRDEFQKRFDKVEPWVGIGGQESSRIFGSDTPAITHKQAAQRIRGKQAGHIIADRLAKQVARQTGQPGRSKIFDYNTDKEITAPLSHGVVKMAVQRIMSKFNAKLRPRTMVFKNVADLKKRNPEVYAKAVTSREDKKGIPENAAGYAFDRTMLIFSDNVHTKQELSFTIAHEVIGHFGLGSFMPVDKFNMLMDDLYSFDPDIQRAADGLMETRGMGKREATEEAMADAAAVMDNSVIRRILNAIKSYLNKLGFSFDDDMTRYFINQSRVYVRTGKTGDVTPLAVYDSFKNLEMRYIEGRANQTFNDVTQRIASIGGGRVHGLGGKILNGIKNSGTAKGKGFLGSAVGAAHDFGRVIEGIQTMHNLAIRSPGIQKLLELFTRQKEETERVKTLINSLMPFDRVTSLFAMVPGIDIKGASKEERSEADYLLSYANGWASPNLTETEIHNGPRLMRDDANGQKVQDLRKDGGFERARAHPNLTRAKLQAGLMFRKTDKHGFILMEEDKGAPPIVNEETGESTPAMKPVLERVQVPFQISDNAWKLYSEARLAVDHSAMEVFFNTYLGMIATNEMAIADMLHANHKLTEFDRQTLLLVSKQYTKMSIEGQVAKGAGFATSEHAEVEAKEFVREVLRVMDMDNGKHKLKDWLGTAENINPNKDAVEGAVKWRSDPAFAHIVSRLQSLHDHRAPFDAKDDKKSLETVIFDMHEADMKVERAENLARQTIMGAYVPGNREGKYEGKIQAYVVDSAGNTTEEAFSGLDPELKAQLHYIRSDSKDEMKKWVADVDRLIAKDSTPVDMPDLNSEGKPTITRVRFKASWGEGVNAPPLGGTVSYDAMSATLSRAGVNLTPDQRKQLSMMTQSADLGARTGLRRKWVPGTDPDVMRSVKKYLERQSHRAGKERYQNSITDVMSDRNGNLWDGDLKTLTDRQNLFLVLRKTGHNAAATQRAYQNMLQYQHRYLSSAEARSRPHVRIIKADGTATVETPRGLGGGYRTKARHMVAGYNKNHGMPAATGDEMVGNVAGYFTGATAVLQLGGALAPAMVNMVSLGSHSIPFLATLNKTTGYGGGHGTPAASAAIYKAMKDMNLITRRALGKPVELAAKIRGHNFASGELYGMNKHEAAFILSLTESGVLTPSTINALTGVAESGSNSDKMVKGVEVWMKMFTMTEQFNRRVTALASYRLERARLIAAGENPDTTVSKEELQLKAEEAVYASQGNYDSFNRPAWAQGNIFKYLYIYKQFVVISIELMRNLGTRERLYFLAFLLLASGLKGLPFADDLLDIIDTLMQKFGIKWDGMEANIAQAADAILPGSAPLVLRGFLDYGLGTTLSTRIALGDLIPGTGMAKAGSSPAREFESIIGPVASAVKGVVGSAKLILRYAAETVGLQDDVTTLADIARSGLGSSALKGYAESLVFASDGTITNSRGQVVAADASIKDVVLRFIGFYPGIATKQHDVDRVGKATSDYSKEITAGYIDAYLKADREGRRDIRQQVREWNVDAKGTPFYIRDFSGKVQRSVKAAERTSTARYLATVPLNSRKFMKDIMRIYGLDSKGIPFAP
jgi:hypothetical protein